MSAGAGYAFDMPFHLMRFRWLPAATLFAIAAVLSQAGKASPAPAPAPTVIDGLGKGLVRLNGPWQFHLGDNPDWAAPAFDDSGWEQLRGDNTWGAQGHAGYTGFAWYRLHLTINPAPGAGPNSALLLSGVMDAYELYLNGARVGGDGKLPPHPVWYYNQPPQTFGLGRLRSGVIAIRVWKAPLTSDEPDFAGGLNNAPVVGSPGAIANLKDAFDYQWLRSNMANFGLNLLYGLVALLSLIAWLRDRKQWYLFWITAYSLFPVINLFLYDMHLPLSNLALGLGEPVGAVQEIALWFLLLWLLQLHHDRYLVRITQIIALSNLAAALCEGLVEGPLWSAKWNSGWITKLQAADFILSGIGTIFVVLPLVLVATALIRRRRLDAARWLVSAFACLKALLNLLSSAVAHTQHLTQWTLAELIHKPLFTMNGNGINAGMLSSILLLASIVYAVYRHSVEKRRRQIALEHEFTSAREVQQVLIPETVPTIPGFAVTSAYRPAQEVGGDFFQIIPLENGSTLIVLGDVSGKGLKAAMSVSLIVGLVHALADADSTPGRLLAQLNRRLTGRLQGGFATCVVVRIDLGGEGTIASAGHPGPFLNGREIDLPGALPLGMASDTTYNEFGFYLRVNDHFSLFTDGLLEARSPAGEIFSFDRLKALFATKPTAAEATQAAVAFGQDDDITVVTLTRLEKGRESTSTLTLRMVR
ncbi:MAG: SpoIIE family protein phosphatase [Terracidiphilus sp.]